MPVDDNTRFTELHAHYKDTFEGLQSCIRQRERYFLATLLMTILLAMRAFAPEGTSAAVSELLNKQFSIPVFNTAVFGSALWFVLLCCVVRYAQVAVLVDRTYPYIHSLEAQLSAEYKGKAFTREGKTYSSNYPKFQKWVSLFYSWVFPLLLLLIVGTSIVLEFFRITSRALVVFNVSVGVFVVISVNLYLHYVHFQKKKEERY